MQNKPTFYNGKATVFLEQISLYDLEYSIEEAIRKLTEIKDKPTFYNGKATVFLEQISLYDLEYSIEEAIRKLTEIKEKYANTGFTSIELSLETEKYEDTQFYAVKGIRPMTEEEKKEKETEKELAKQERILRLQNELDQLKKS